MARIDDGGPAFPRTGYYPPPMPSDDWDRDAWAERAPTQTAPQDGVSMRDYFAAKALTGLLAAHAGKSIVPKVEDAANMCFAYADAMIAERDKRPTPESPPDATPALRAKLLAEGPALLADRFGKESPAFELYLSGSWGWNYGDGSIVFATPFWGDEDGIAVEMGKADGTGEPFVTIPFQATGNVEADLNTYMDAIKPLLADPQRKHSQ